LLRTKVKSIGVKMSVEENLRLMKTLDDAWNSQDWDTFEKRHANHVEVFWPGQPEPTKGVLRIRRKQLHSSRYSPTTM
jgi:uncharacterized membrane protein